MKKFVFDPQMRLSHIWINFHVGNIEVTQSGAVKKTALVESEAQVHAVDVSNVKKFRKELHRQLDDQIDQAVMMVPYIREHGVKRTIVSK